MYKKSPLKYTGGKYRLLPTLIPLLQQAIDNSENKTFVDLFSGSMVVSLNINADKFIINDMNKHVIDFYNDCRDEHKIDDILSIMKESNNSKEFYYKVRDAFNVSPNSKLFYYLNKHCFNGLHRVNSKGHFNVSFGKYKKVNANVDGLKLINNFMNKNDIELSNNDFSDVDIPDGSVIYCDPPYLPLTSDFKYSKNGFSLEDQKRLVELIKYKVSERGCKAFISNHDTSITRELYNSAKSITEVSVRRSVSCIGDERVKAKELMARFE